MLTEFFKGAFVKKPNGVSKLGTTATILVSLTFAVFFTACSHKSTSPPSPDNAVTIAEDAYIFGFPLVLMDITRRQLTNAEVVSGYTTPMGHFNFLPFFPDASFRGVVLPNNDTFYSSAWLDLRGGPFVLSMPNTDGRYHLMQIMDAYTNVFAAPGTRTTGNGGARYLLSSPDWAGSVPHGMTELKSPTNHVWILGRTQVNSKEDGERIVMPIMRQYKLTLLSGAPVPVAGIDPTVPSGDPIRLVEDMPVDAFFSYLSRLMTINPPSEADKLIMQRMAKIGVGPGKRFEPAQFTAKEQEGIKATPQKVFAELRLRDQSMPRINGWSSLNGAGTYGMDYQFRAYTAFVALAANLSADAMYFNCKVDAENTPLNGAKNYILRFEAGKTPPVNAFWSLTLYGPDSYFTDNAINRYAIGDRSGLAKNVDGSVNIYIQHASPGKGKESNWLPAPAGEFKLTLRAYYPKEALLDGSWKVPAIIIQNTAVYNH